MEYDLLIREAEAEDAAALIAFLDQIGQETDFTTLDEKGILMSESEMAAFIEKQAASDNQIQHYAQHQQGPIRSKVIGAVLQQRRTLSGRLGTQDHVWICRCKGKQVWAHNNAYHYTLRRSQREAARSPHRD